MRNVVIVMVAVLTGCQYHDIIYEKPANESYLPLEVGNYWNFETISSSQVQEPNQIHREVTSIVTINNHDYYLLVNTSTNSAYTYKDSSYYRVDNNGYVFIYRKSSPRFEDNRFRLNGNNHDTWSYPVESGDEAHVTLTMESVTLGNVTLANCKSHFFDVVRWADEENTITLAPGVGFVKEYSNAWGIGQELKSAKIGDRVFNF